MNNQEKFEWVHWVLHELSNVDALKGTWDEEIEQARDFIEDLRDEYIYS